MMSRLTTLGAVAATSPRDVADQVETVMASLPTPDIVLAVATGKDGVIEGKKVKRFLDMSTTGARMATRVAEALAAKNITGIDLPVSGGVGGAEKGTVAVMYAGPRADFDELKDVLVGHRQAVLHRREARHGPDHEALQQPALRRQHGALVRGDGDGRQGRARPADHGRRDQRELGRQHRGARQVSARR